MPPSKNKKNWCAIAGCRRKKFRDDICWQHWKEASVARPDVIAEDGPPELVEIDLTKPSVETIVERAMARDGHSNEFLVACAVFSQMGDDLDLSIIGALANIAVRSKQPRHVLDLAAAAKVYYGRVQREACDVEAQEP